MSKAALVTGGARRLGRAMVLRLARDGHDVAIHCLSGRDEARALADEVRATGRRAAVLEADLLDAAQTGALIARAGEALGSALTVLVNNASIFEFDTIATATRESWDRHLESNLRAPFVLTQHFAEQAPEPALDAAGEPVARALIVNMVDQRVFKLTPGFMSYTLAKSALWTLTRTAAQALAPRVRVNAIGPGPTMRGPRQSEAHFARQRAATILNRGADSAEVAAALGYLLEAPSVTGQMICVDGGQHLGWRTPDVLGPE